MKIIGLYSGKLSRIGPKNSPTGIYKQAIEEAQVDELGFVGDIQADKRFHGGPEKALHQYALSSYEKIIKRYPLLHQKALPGAIGENLSVTEMEDDNVCIGDIFEVGTTILQVSSPRIPCWKIDEKFKQPDLNRFVLEKKITGWYYRVLKAGIIRLDDEMRLRERVNPLVSIEKMMAVIYNQHTNVSPEVVSQAVGLDPEWKKRIKQKYNLQP